MFVKGDTVLFSTALTLTMLMEPLVNQVGAEFTEIHMISNSFGKGIDRRTFIDAYAGSIDKNIL